MTAGAPETTEEEGEPGAATGPSKVRILFDRWLRRYPVSIGAPILVILVSIATGSVFDTLTEADPELYEKVAYGLPSLQAGRWWTPLTGTFVVDRLLPYLPVLVLLVVVSSASERRFGSIKTFILLILGGVAGAVATSLFLLPFDGSGWFWADTLGNGLDTGPSASIFALLGAITATIQPTWRIRIRAAAGAYLISMLLNAGLLWDLEHFFAYLLGLVLGPFLAGRRPEAPSLRFKPRTQRAIVALVVAMTAFATLIEAAMPGLGGPFASGDLVEDTTTATATFGLAIFGILLICAADGLRRGRRSAWVFVTTVLSLLFLGSALTAGSAERTADLILTGGQLVLLLATARSFPVKPRRQSFRRTTRHVLVAVAGLFAYTAIGFAVFQEDFEPKASVANMIAEFVSRLFFTTSDQIVAETTAADVFVTSIGIVWTLVVVTTLIGLFYSSRKEINQPDDTDRLRSMLRQNESSSIEWMLTWEGNTLWFSDDGLTAIGYRVVGNVALALGDPVGPLPGRAAALTEFDAFCFERGWIPCLFAAGEQTKEVLGPVGWDAIQVAEDGVVPLPNLEFKGKAWQDVRTAINKAGKSDIRLETALWSELTPAITDQFQAISSGWVSDKSLPEMGFTLGALPECEDPEVRMHYAIDDKLTVEGVTSWMPVAADGEITGWTIDLMRRRDEGFRPVMEFLIGSSAMAFKEQGYQFISLSAAPLAKAPEHLEGSSDKVVLQKLLDFLGDTLEPYYGFKSLLNFKAKFQPDFHPMYLVYPDEGALAEIGIAICRAYMPTATLTDWLKIGWDMAAKGPDH